MQLRTRLRSILCLAAAFVLAPFSLALGSDSLRCGSKIVNTGDSRSKVQQLCGEPAEIVHTVILRRPSYVSGGRVIFFGDQAVETPAETWTYNFGPNKLMHRLRFVDGLLESVVPLEYGHR